MSLFLGWFALCIFKTLSGDKTTAADFTGIVWQEQRHDSFFVFFLKVLRHVGKNPK